MGSVEIYLECVALIRCVDDCMLVEAPFDGIEGAQRWIDVEGHLCCVEIVAVAGTLMIACDLLVVGVEGKLTHFYIKVS